MFKCTEGPWADDGQLGVAGQKRQVIRVQSSFVIEVMIMEVLPHVNSHPYLS